MRTSITTIIGLGLAAMLAAGCTDVFGTTREFMVETRNTQGGPFRASRVYWYPTPIHGGPVPEHNARCLDDGCARWGWESEPAGIFYVAAEWRAPHPDPLCQYSAYDAAPVERAAGETRTVRLTMETTEACQ